MNRTNEESQAISPGGQYGEYSRIPESEEYETISQTESPLLAVKNLQTSFHTNRGTVQAVDGVSFELESGEILGIVGESGCGKTVTALSLTGLIHSPGSIHGGEVLFKGKDLIGAKPQEMRKIRGNDISMIFQEPMKALNPVYDIGWQVGEPLRVHHKLSSQKSRDRAIELLRDVGIPSPETRVDDYPHQFSGGMRQRAMIAMALACEPDLLIADEPTTALDVTIQSQILDLIREQNEKKGMAVLLITHNLGVVAQLCDKVAVMYAGRIVEYGDIEKIFSDPRHPYTRGLVECVPDPRLDGQEFEPIGGNVADLSDLPTGCNFHPRCPYAVEKCKQGDPRLRPVTNSQYSACIWRDPQ